MSNLERSRRAYQILGLPDHASVDDVKRAYRDLALLHHPDKNMNDPNAADRFKELSTAYQLLSNPEKKKVYDASLFKGASPMAHTSRHEANFHAEMQSARASRPRTASKTAPLKRTESSYTAEKTELFRQREKERQQEMLRRREKEKQEQREKEIARLKKLQENKQREEERRRKDAEKAKEKLNKILTEGSTPTPRQSKPLDDATVRHNERMERLRQEKIRQDEWRRREQEKQLEKKLENLRQKEEERAQELLSATQTALRDRVSVVESTESEDRKHCIEMEEQYERSIIVKGLERVKAAYELSVKQRHLSSHEQGTRQEIQFEALMERVMIELLAKEDNARALLLRDHRFLFSRLSLLFDRGAEMINQHERNRADLFGQAVIGAGRLRAAEEKKRHLLQCQFLEGVIRGRFLKDYVTIRDRIIAQFLDGANHQLFSKEMLVKRKRLENDESQERKLFSLQRMEGTLRCTILEQEKKMVSLLFSRLMKELDFTFTKAIGEMLREKKRCAEEAHFEKRQLLDEIGRLNKQLSNAAVVEDELRAQLAQELQERQTDLHMFGESTEDETYRALDEQHATTTSTTQKEMQNAAAAAVKPIAFAEASNKLEMNVLTNGTQHLAAASPHRVEPWYIDPHLSSGEKTMVAAPKKTETSSVGMQTQSFVEEVTRPATSQESELQMLRRRLELFEQAADNRELITLLCNENRRLLETNAKLVEDNWKLAQNDKPTTVSASPQMRGKTWKSPNRF